MPHDAEILQSNLPTPEEFIEALNELSLDVWRAAALSTISGNASAALAYEVDREMSAIDPLDLWNLFDDAEAVLHRFNSTVAVGLSIKSSELQGIRVATRRAIAVLAAPRAGTARHGDALLRPFIQALQLRELNHIQHGNK